MLRFSKLLQDQANENIYPDEGPRNKLINRTLGVAANTIDPSGSTNKLLNSIRQSKLDIDKAKAPIDYDSPEGQQMLLDMAMMSPALGMTRAVKQLGPVVGKGMNYLAESIKDLSPQAEHISNLKFIQNILKGSKNKIGEGNAKEVFDVPNVNKVVKKQFLGSDDLDRTFNIDEGIKEQLIFNKLEELVPNTKSYQTSKNIWQVQDKVNPISKSGMFRSQESAMTEPKVESAAWDMIKRLGDKIKPADLTRQNVGYDKSGNVKFFDVNNFDFPQYSIRRDMLGDPMRNSSGKVLLKTSTPFDLSDVEKLNNTYKKLPEEAIHDNFQNFLEDDIISQAFESSKPNYINELLRKLEK